MSSSSPVASSLALGAPARSPPSRRASPRPGARASTLAPGASRGIIAAPAAPRRVRVRVPPAAGARSVAPRAGAHVGIVDDAAVHSSSLVSTGLAPASAPARPLSDLVGFQGVHHVAVIVESLAESLAFYRDFLGLPVNPDRPADKLPYDGAWLMIGPEMVHLMELPNPDPRDPERRPAHGGKDRHFCVGVKNLTPLVDALERRGVPYTASRSGRPAIFFRDPDANTLEVVEGLEWRGENDRNLTL